jgi:hypothetical protein
LRKEIWLSSEWADAAGVKRNSASVKEVFVIAAGSATFTD